MITGSPPNAMEPIKTLIVDDFEQYRNAIRRVLQRRSKFKIVGEASDGLEAVRIASELLPDLILLDISMPKLGGIEAWRRIRKLSPESKILFVTAAPSAELLDEAFRLGAQGCLHKMDIAGELFETVDAVMEGELFASAHTEYRINADHDGDDGAKVEGCRECLGLSARYQEAVDEFRQRVRRLSQAAIAYESGTYARLFEQCETARQNCAHARDNLFGHLREEHEGGVK